MYQLDKKDKLLLHALQKNARASLVSLGREIELSRSATHDRITRLEEEGVIKGYTVVVDDVHASKIAAFLTISLQSDSINAEVTKKNRALTVRKNRTLPNRRC